MDVLQVVTMRTPALSSVNYGTGSTQNGVLLLETILAGIWMYLGGDWNKLQATECAKMMFSEYYWMTVSELKHFSLKCKQAMFECQKDFSKFSTKHMAMCFQEYSSEVLAMRADQNYLKTKDEPKQVESPDFDATPYIEQITAMLGNRADMNEVQRTHENISPEEYAKQMGIDAEKLKAEIDAKNETNE